ncbi:hypothetical protein M0804_007383 [Polistes exclamans]|nr:hypothetical protein M0804_007383 [Polistes exclamans]
MCALVGRALEVDAAANRSERTDGERRNRADNISNHDEAGPITANPGLCIHPGRLYSPAAPGETRSPSLPPLHPPHPLAPPSSTTTSSSLPSFHNP